MKILQVASEVYPLVKTGGLADVVGALSIALARRGHEVVVLLPCYRQTLRAALGSTTPVLALGDPLGLGPASLRRTTLPGSTEAGGSVDVWLLDAPALYDRDGGPYLDAAGIDHADNHVRFGLLSRVGATLASFGALAGWQPDVVHAHDWQAGLVPAYQHAFGGRTAASVFTVHNLHFPGTFDPEALSDLGLPPSIYAVEGLESYGRASALKAGLYFADALTTVSPTYASEIQTEAGGRGLHGLLRTRAQDLHGLINGIDEDVWSPDRDTCLPARYDADDRRGKAVCAAAVRGRFGLAEGGRLVGMVSRLSDQKGVDLLLDAWPEVAGELDLRLCVLGSGDPRLEARLAEAARRDPERVGFVRGYEEPLSHLLVAGCDALVVPSRFEPCGLTQLYAMRYGTLPIVRRTGGLADTVRDADADPEHGTGIVFDAPDADDLAGALRRAAALLSDRPRADAVQRRGMTARVGWDDAVAGYERLFTELSTPPS